MTDLANVNTNNSSLKHANFNIGKEPVKATNLPPPVGGDTGPAINYEEWRRDDAFSARHLTEAFRVSDITEAVEQIAHDVEDRDRRVIVMIQRLDEATQRTGLALAYMLGGQTFTRKDKGGFSAIKSIEDVKTAISEALAASGMPTGTRSAFVETGIVDDETSALAALTLGKNKHDMHSLSEWLKERNARFVIALTASEQLQPRTAASRRAGSYIMPWTPLWLFDLATQVELDYRELNAIHGAALAEMERVDRLNHGIREETLFLHAQEISDKHLDHRGNYESLKKALEDAVKASSSAQDFKKQARVSLETMFDAAQPVKVSNAICRILFAVTILAGDPPEEAAFALTRALLPEGEAPLDLMSDVRRARWQRDIETDSDLQRERRPPPSWTEIFDEDKSIYIEAAKIELNDRLEFAPLRRLRHAAPREWLRTKTAFLRELAERVKTRGLAQTIDRVHFPTFANFLVGLRGLDKSFFQIDDFVTVLTGNRGTKDLSARRQVDEGLLPEQFKAFAQKIRLSGDVLRLANDEDFQKSVLTELAIPDDAELDAAFLQIIERSTQSGGGSVLHNPFLAEMFQHIEETKEDAKSRLAQYLVTFANQANETDKYLRTTAASDIFSLLNYSAKITKATPEFLVHFVERLDQCLSPHNCWIIFAYNVLYGENFKIDEKTLGALTLKHFVGTGRDAFHICLVHLLETLRSMIGGAVDQATERLAPFDYWADAVWAAAEHPKFAIFGKAVAVYVDDFMSSSEIPWNARTLDPASGAPPVLAPQFFGLRVARTEPNLLQRLFNRDAKTYLGSLERLGQLAFENPNDHVAFQVDRLLKDVFWVLIDEIDAVEAGEPEMDRNTLERIVWEAITQALRLPLCSTTEECKSLVMESANPKALRREGVALLDLYAPALLLHWRFRALPPAPMKSGSPEGVEFRECLRSLQTAGQNRRGSIFKAFGALQSAERRLVSHFKAQGCTLTEARHEVRRKVISGIGRVFAPPLAARI